MRNLIFAIVLIFGAIGLASAQSYKEYQDSRERQYEQRYEQQYQQRRQQYQQKVPTSTDNLNMQMRREMEMQNAIVRDRLIRGQPPY